MATASVGILFIDRVYDKGKGRAKVSLLSL